MYLYVDILTMYVSMVSSDDKVSPSIVGEINIGAPKMQKQLMPEQSNFFPILW